MNDLISRQAAIEALGERPLVWTDDDQYTLGERNQYDIDRLAIGTLPSAEVTLCHLDSPCEYQNADIELPSAQPEQKKGEWIVDEKRFGCTERHCSLCGAILEGDDWKWRNNNYCYHCGADMRGEEDGCNTGI